MSQPTQPAQVQEKSPKPQGLLPKNVQSWLLVGLAFLMVAIMWLTGGKKPPTPAKAASSTPPALAPLEVNETKISELQNRIEQLQRDQMVAQNALSQQTRLLGGAAQDSQQTQQQSASGYPPEQRAEDPIQAERKRRAYVSLFASNVALTYRKTSSNPPSATAPEPEATPGTTNRVPVGPDAPQVAQLLKEMQAKEDFLAPRAASPSPAGNDSAEKPNDRKEDARNPAAVSAGSASAAAGKTYLLFEGTILETVLINRLDGGFAGPVECLLSTDVYSNDRQHLLIPAGSKLLGETKKVDALGQTRLAVVFHRLLMPDGFSVSLDQFKGLNQIGDTGLRDQVNNHYLRIFGVSLAVGALGAVAEAGSAGSLSASSSDLVRQGFAASTAQSSAQILDKFLNIMPTVTIREGHRVKVYLSGDLAVPDYNNDTIPFHFSEGQRGEQSNEKNDSDLFARVGIGGRHSDRATGERRRF
jgi:type IV secretion system protein TrbI